MGARETPADEESVGPAKAGDAPGSHAKQVNSEELFEGASEVQIHHLGIVYRLRLTRQGKLILNK